MAATHQPLELFPLHHVPMTRPFLWLYAGAEAMAHSLGASLAYGVIVALLGALILAYQEHPLYIGAAITAFLVVGPVITAGVCELARCRDHGEPVDFQASLEAVRHNRGRLLGFAAVLAAVALAIFGAAALFLYQVTGGVAPAFTSTVWGDVLAQLSTLQLATYALAFLAVCAVVFSLSVVSVPMLIDRHVTPATAMRLSLKAALGDIPAMLLWALLIVALVAFGYGTRLWGMVVILPLLGHATWYAYRDIVEEA